jgi:hypothetical protein
LYFDSRKDRTLQLTRLDGKKYRKTIVEEHVSLIQEPESKYLSHVTPCSGRAKNITKSITDFLTENGMSANNTVAVRYDGTNVNTGRNGGVIWLLEDYCKKPLQWLVCELHANELPVRYLLEHLDGTTTGPRAFSSIIGKALANCKQLPTASFEAIQVNLSELFGLLVLFSYLVSWFYG